MATNRKLGRTTDIRMSILKNLTTDLLVSGKVETTLQRAKEVKSIVDSLISLAIKGTDLSSLELADKIDKIFISNPNITFIIGGSNGIRQDILDKSNMLLSFSKLTYPHGLFRLILLEQIYRSFKILNNESYHK